MNYRTWRAKRKILHGKVLIRIGRLLKASGRFLQSLCRNLELTSKDENLEREWWAQPTVAAKMIRFLFDAITLPILFFFVGSRPEINRYTIFQFGAFVFGVYSFRWLHSRYLKRRRQRKATHLNSVFDS